MSTDIPMQIGIVGLGRMGANLVRRLIRDGHSCEIERGYCLMIGGDADGVGHLQPIFATFAPAVDPAARTPGRKGRPGSGERATCGAARTAQTTSSRWSTTASSTA